MFKHKTCETCFKHKASSFIHTGFMCAAAWFNNVCKDPGITCLEILLPGDHSVLGSS
jgi:hypothetical protein